MPRKTVTIRDVAKQAQVSVSTVSQILNGNTQYVVAEKRERVLNAAKELHYRPNAIARSMVRRHTATIGVVISAAQNPLFTSVLEGIQEVLSSEGYHILLASAPDHQQETEAIEVLRAQQVDGFIFVSLSVQNPIDHLVRLKEEGVPFIVINRSFSEDYQCNQIQFNEWEAGYLAAKHLINLGHRRIATISGSLHGIPEWRSATERQRGWLQALEENGLEVRPEWIVKGDYTCNSGYEAALQLVRQSRARHEQPTALFVANDEMAIGALRCFHYAGVRVPYDLALITVGDPPYAAFMAPALTTFAHPVPEAGRVATRLLLDQIEQDNTQQVHNIIFSFSLMVRESCGTNREPNAIV